MVGLEAFHYQGSLLLYGHLHNSDEEIYFQECIRDMRWNTDGNVRAYNVGCMMPCMGYEPRTLTEIIDYRAGSERLNYEQKQ